MIPKTVDIRKSTVLPTHVAIVPDGNGRWAEQRGLPRLEGHRSGTENMLRMVDYLMETPIKYLTIYGFSTENWSRPQAEVKGLFRLLEEFIKRHTEEIHHKNIKLRHIGRLNELPNGLQSAINKAVELTQHNTGMTLSVAFNYGGRAEIIDAVRRMITDGVKPEQVNEELFDRYLYTAGLPNVDLLVRTGDQLRLSNFLIWQTVYSEYHFAEVLWPDFGKEDMEKALLSYSQRQRRFGGL